MRRSSSSTSARDRSRRTATTRPTRRRWRSSTPSTGSTEEIAPDQIGLALTAADVRRIAASGRKVALIGVENAYPLGTDLSRVKEFYDRGGRYMSLAHNGHSQFADSNTGERDGKWLHNGLSELGRQVIIEMNKWGIMVDVSHPSKQANLQAIALSRAPVIASHSAARALADHSRNMDDEQLHGAEEERRRDPDGGLRRLREDQAAGLTGARRGRRQAAAGDAGSRRRPRRSQADAQRAARVPRRMAALDEQFPPPPMATVARLRGPHRLPGEEDRHRPRRHLVRLRRRRRRERAGTAPRRPSTSRSSWCAAATPRSRSARSGAATCCA